MTRARIVELVQCAAVGAVLIVTVLSPLLGLVAFATWLTPSAVGALVWAEWRLYIRKRGRPYPWRRSDVIPEIYDYEQEEAA